MPAAWSTEATVYAHRRVSTRLRLPVGPVERFNGMRSLAICRSDVMPVDSWTAKPMTSQDGNTAMVRSGMRPSRGPFPLVCERARGRWIDPRHGDLAVGEHLELAEAVGAEGKGDAVHLAAPRQQGQLEVVAQPGVGLEYAFRRPAGLVGEGGLVQPRGHLEHALHPLYRRVGSAVWWPCPVLESVERLGIVVQDVVLPLLADFVHLLEIEDGVHLAGRVGVAVVGADDQVALSRVLEDVGDVVVGLAGDVDAVLGEQILGKTPARPPGSGSRSPGRSTAPTGRKPR